MERTLCLCFPCILSYMGGYVYPKAEDQTYAELQGKGFSLSEQRQIAEEWYWVAVERETAVKDYLRGYVTFRDGCWWRPPPSKASSSRSVSSTASTTGSAT